MRIFVPKELHPTEKRIALLPSGAAKLARLGAEIEVERGLGESLNWADAEYETAGAKLSHQRGQSLAEADLILRLRKPPLEEVALMKTGSIHVSFLDPFNERELVLQLVAAKITAISMEMIPRTTLSQKMDAISSQANLAGYVAVILAATRASRIFPMLITPAGTIKPLRVFVIGVGVAGLQAIATARRLGAAVEAFDTRPVVEEQVKSLGARFVKADLGETGETAGGYAKPLTPEQLEKQREVMAQHVTQADVVITAAQVFGRKAPIIVTTEMVKSMKPGSMILDIAIESGGNVECSKYDAEVEVNSVQVIGFANLAGRVASNASEMYSNNLSAFVEHFWNKDAKTFGLDMTNDILKSCVITHAGEICSEMIRIAYA
ncbi:MAG TPA: NAD(P) transhydrogenase subunit alpha [Chthoniobacterales bacterium]|nr:NAD(P) transhydrogenase subunit alpha [Chthoniobacterales bacterium]